MTDSHRGIPVKDRTPDQIRNALRGQPTAVQRGFLRLQDYARNEHLGLTPLAHRTGISSSILSQCFNGTYDKGDYIAILARIEKFFTRLQQKAQYAPIRRFQATSLAKVLFSVFDKTRIVRRIQPVQGPEQVGKTRIAKEYTQENDSGRTIYTKLSGGSRSGCGDFIWTLADRLGIPYSVKLREKRLRIREALSSCDLIFIDELHLCFTWPDKVLADFWDYIRTDIYSDGERGVVLLATNSDMMEGIRTWKTRSGYNVGQLLGRMRNEVLEIDPAEDILIGDVRMLVKRYYPAGASTISRLHKMSLKDQLGHLGLLEDVMNEAWTLAKSRGKKLNDGIVDKTAASIMEQLKARKGMYA